MFVDNYNLHKVDELFTNMSNCIWFVKIYLKQAFIQLELDKKSADILTLNTHLGLFKCNRLWYGVSSATAIWQRIMENL